MLAVSTSVVQMPLPLTKLILYSQRSFFIFYFILRMLYLSGVPAGSPSRGGDVVVYVFDIKQTSFPTPFYSVLVSIVFMAFSTVFHSVNSPGNSPLS